MAVNFGLRAAPVIDARCARSGAFTATGSDGYASRLFRYPVGLRNFTRPKYLCRFNEGNMQRFGEITMAAAFAAREQTS